MRETNKAKAAFEDYYAMGPGRSLSKLARVYQSDTEGSPPTTSHRWLKRWSTEHGWQNRVAERDAELAEARMEKLKEQAVNSGYALFYKRIADLNDLAEKMFDGLMAGEKPQNYLGAVREFRALLADIADEMGERPTQINVFDWRDRVIEALRKGELEPEDVRNELGDDLATQLFDAAGVRVAAGGES